MDLPDRLVEQIMASLDQGLPDGVTVSRPKPRVLSLEVSDEFLSQTGRTRGLAFSFLAQIGVRNRDGITPYSIAGAVWSALDAAVHRASLTGIPWPQDVAAHMHAFTQPHDDAVHAWITAPDHPPIVFPPVDLRDVTFVRPSLMRLPYPLPRKFRLPRSGPIGTPQSGAHTAPSLATAPPPVFTPDQTPLAHPIDPHPHQGPAGTVTLNRSHTVHGTASLALRRSSKLDPVLCDRILAAIRPMLPEGVRVKRRRGHVLDVMTRIQGAERFTTTAGTFGHLPRGIDPEKAMTLVYREVLDLIDDHFTRGGLTWPGLATTSTTATIQTRGHQLHALLTDTTENTITFPPVSTTRPTP